MNTIISGAINPIIIRRRKIRVIITEIINAILIRILVILKIID
jgi:hypothetical protein